VFTSVNLSSVLYMHIFIF